MDSEREKKLQDVFTRTRKRRPTEQEKKDLPRNFGLRFTALEEEITEILDRLDAAGL